MKHHLTHKHIASAVLLTFFASGCLDANVDASLQPLAEAPASSGILETPLSGTPLFDGMMIDEALAEAFAGERVDDFGGCDTDTGLACMWWEVGNVVTAIRDVTCTSGALCVDGYELHAIVTQTSWRTRSWHYANDVVEVNETGALVPRGEIRVKFNRSAGLTVQHFDPDGAPLGPPISGPMALSSQGCQERYCSGSDQEPSPNAMCVALEVVDHVERGVRSFVRGSRVEIDHPTLSGGCRELDDSIRDYLRAVSGGVRSACDSLCDEMYAPLSPGQYVWDSETGTYIPRTAEHGEEGGIIVFGPGGGSGGGSGTFNPYDDLTIDRNPNKGTHGEGDRDRDSGTPGGSDDDDDDDDGDGDDDDDKRPEDQGPPILSFF